MATAFSECLPRLPAVQETWVRSLCWEDPLEKEMAAHSSTLASRCRAAQLASIRQMSGHVSRGSAREYQADERAGVAGLSWRVSG